MSRLYSYLLKDTLSTFVRFGEPLARVRDWAVCSGFAPGGPVRLLDATVVMVMLASAGVLIRMADTSPDRNPSAHAIAQKFSFPNIGSNIAPERFEDTPETLKALANPSVLANLEARLTFVPVEAMLWNALPTSTEPPPIRPVALDNDRASGGPVLDPLSVVILRGLPEGSVLSSGARVSLTAWAVAAGDFDKLVVTLGKSADRPVLASPVLASVELINPAGFPDGAAQIEIRRLANSPMDKHQGVALKPPAPAAQAEDVPEHQPRRLKAVHKRRGARRPPLTHRVVREVKAVAKRVPSASVEKTLPAAETAAPADSRMTVRIVPSTGLATAA